jgi:hypothetical protein
LNVGVKERMWLQGLGDEFLETESSYKATPIQLASSSRSGEIGKGVSTVSRVSAETGSTIEEVEGAVRAFFAICINPICNLPDQYPCTHSRKDDAHLTTTRGMEEVLRTKEQYRTE